MLISIAAEKHGHHEHSAEASAILFQIFVLLARFYAHKPSVADEAWVAEFDKFIPPFVDYAQHVAAARGVEETRSLLTKMYEESMRVFHAAVRSAHTDPRYAALEKSNELHNLLTKKRAFVDIAEYGNEFVDHVIAGQDTNVRAIVKDLIVIIGPHRR